MTASPSKAHPQSEYKLPQRFRRARCKYCKWDIPRSFAGFKAVDPSALSVLGAAPKCMIRHESDSNLWYMAKAAEKNGEIETYTEFLINKLGERLDFPMAHSGLVLVDGELRFVSRNFLHQGEKLVHGSLMIQNFFEDDLEKIGKNPWDEQRTYDIDMIRDLMERFCGERSFGGTFLRFIEMLVFDALIGSMDRHSQNWGMIVEATVSSNVRFAPIFDSARALLWDYDESRLRKLSATTEQLHGYARRARPKIGCVSLGKVVNHFELVAHLYEKFRVETLEALTKVTPEKVRRAAQIVREYPFIRAFSPLRMDMLIKLLQHRADTLNSIIVREKAASV